MFQSNIITTFKKIKFYSCEGGLFILNPFQKTVAICETLIFPEIISSRIDGISAHIIEHNIIDFVCKKAKGKNMEEFGALINGYTTNSNMQFNIHTTNEFFARVYMKISETLETAKELFNADKNFYVIKNEKREFSIENMMKIEMFDNIFYPTYHTKTFFAKSVLRRFFTQYILKSTHFKVVAAPSLPLNVKINQNVKEKKGGKIASNSYPEFINPSYENSNDSPQIMKIIITPSITSIEEEVALDVFSRLLNVTIQITDINFTSYSKILYTKPVLIIEGKKDNNVLKAYKNVLSQVNNRNVNNYFLKRSIEQTLFSLSTIILDPLSLTKIYSEGYIRWGEKAWLLNYVTSLENISLKKIKKIINVIKTSNCIIHLQASENFMKETEELTNAAFSNL